MTVTPMPIRTVLCAVDDSSHAPAVAMAAAGLADHLHARLVLIRVDDRMSGVARDSEAARQAMAEFVTSGVPGGLGYRGNTEARAVAGAHAAEAILRETEAERAGLIVMGTRGRGALGRAILGSTAHDVLRGAHVPVAIVPPSDPEIVDVVGARTIPRFGIVLVPVDLRSDARAQLEVTGLIGSGSQHRPMLLHVSEHGTDHDLVRERMNPLGLAIPGGRGAKLLVLDGDVDDAILKVTRKDEVGLVILGRSRDAAGRIACSILEHTRAVVIVVP